MYIDIIPSDYRSVRHWRCENDTYGNPRYYIFALDFYPIFPGGDKLKADMKQFGLKPVRNKSINNYLMFEYVGYSVQTKIDTILSHLSSEKLAKMTDAEYEHMAHAAWAANEK
jgi:hypothetical protein